MAAAELAERPQELTQMERRVLIDLQDAIRRTPREGGALAVVLGLPVLVRNLLVLERKGYTRAVLLVGGPSEAAAVEGVLARHPRIGLEVRVIDGKSDASDRTLGPALDALLEGADEQPLVLLWDGTLSFGRYAPELVSATPPQAGALAGERGGAVVGPLLLGAKAVERARGATSLEEIASSLEAGGALERVPLEHEPVLVRERADLRVAEEALLASLRKPIDGAVAKYDRHISLAISRRLMRLPISPNAVTVCAGLMGLACGLLAAVGGYLPMLVAAIGFQANSILDGIDGEVARAKLLESRLGQWLDTLADDVSNLSYAVGVGVGCYHTFGQPAFLVLAAAAGLGYLLSDTILYHQLLTVYHSGDLNEVKMPWMADQESNSRSGASSLGFFGRLSPLFRRDALAFLSTVCAAIGQTWVMALLYAVGSNIFWTLFAYFRFLAPKGPGPDREVRRA
jgi:hypothetical protein